MKHRLVKIIALVLALVLAFSTSAFAQTDTVEKVASGVVGACLELIDDGLTQFSADTTGSMDENTDVEEPEQPENPEIPDTPDNPDVPVEPEEPEQPKPTFDEIPGDTVVGRMYICSQIVFLGHAWIYIENTFDCDIPVGCYTAKPESGVSVGTFLFTRSDGGGLYYNVETHVAEKYGLKSQAWLGMDITKDQLLKVNKEIVSWNYWGLYLNCTFFASKVWNSVSDDFIMPMMFPIFTKAQIKTHGGNSDVVMIPAPAEECFKQKGSGKNARLEVVSAGSLDSRLL